MIFNSKLPGVAKPRLDVFNYIFEARRPYDGGRVLFQEDKSGKTLTLNELERKSRRLASILIKRFGIHPGDVIAILAKDSIMYPIIYFGILATGATVQLIPVMSELAHTDVSARMQQAESRLLITDEHMLQMATIAAAEAGDVEIFLPAENFDGTPDEQEEFAEFRIENNASAEQQAAFLNRTSGSTGGKMKTVITTHAHFIATLEATVHTVPTNTDPDNDIWLSTLSFGFFINAKLNMGLNILLGIPCVIMDEPFGPENFDVISRQNITFLFIPPPVAAKIAGDTSSKTSDTDVSSVKWVLSAGASMHKGLQQSVSEKLNNVHFDLEWGTSETLLIAMQMDGDNCPEGSSGKLVNGIQARVVDPHTRLEMGPGRPGEILVRNSACRFAGYKKNEEANRNTFDDEGWFHSGDYGYLDEHNNVYITDRLKELIRVGSGYGVHIAAVELENIIFQHDMVAEVIVTGVPHPSSAMERATAFVVLKDEWKQKQEVAQEELENLAAVKLTGLRTLTGGIIIVDKFPTIGFKINRLALKALASSMTA